MVVAGQLEKKTAPAGVFPGRGSSPFGFGSAVGVHWAVRRQGVAVWDWVAASHGGGGSGCTACGVAADKALEGTSAGRQSWGCSAAGNERSDAVFRAALAPAQLWSSVPGGSPGLPWLVLGAAEVGCVTAALPDTRVCPGHAALRGRRRRCLFSTNPRHPSACTASSVRFPCVGQPEGRGLGKYVSSDAWKEASLISTVSWSLSCYCSFLLSFSFFRGVCLLS